MGEAWSVEEKAQKLEKADDPYEEESPDRQLGSHESASVLWGGLEM